MEKKLTTKNCIIFGCIFIFYLLNFLIFDKDEFVIAYNKAEVNEIYACCIEIKSIDYFENYSNLFNYSRTITYQEVENREICVPEEENIFGWEYKEISKKDLTKEWLEENCKCIFNLKDDTSIPCKDLECSNRKDECLKYKFGEYEIEKI